METVDAIARGCAAVEPELTPRHEALQHCAEKVEGRARKILEMRYLRGESPAAIAQTTGMTANAVSTLLYRVRKALKACIERQLLSSEGHLDARRRPS